MGITITPHIRVLMKVFTDPVIFTTECSWAWDPGTVGVIATVGADIVSRVDTADATTGSPPPVIAAIMKDRLVDASIAVVGK